jgi:hypothetical protein
MRTLCLGHAMGMLAAVLVLLAGRAFAAEGPGHMAPPETGSVSAPPAVEYPPATGSAATPTALKPGEIQKLLTFPKYDEEAWAKLVEKGRTLLADVKDDTFGYDEAAFYWLVGHVNKTAPDLLTPGEKDTDTAYNVLLAHPESTRGEVVTIRGAYLRVYPFHVLVSGLQKDVPMLYECTIGEMPLTNDSLLATVVTTVDPMTYLEVGNEVRVKGYFYKNRLYERASDNTRRPSPMIVAQRLDPVDPNASRSMVSSIMGDPWMMPVIGVLMLMVGAFIYLKVVTKPKPKMKYERVQTSTDVHKFHLRRPNLPPSPPPAGTGSPDSGPKP